MYLMAKIRPPREGHYLKTFGKVPHANLINLILSLLCKN